MYNILNPHQLDTEYGIQNLYILTMHQKLFKHVEILDWTYFVVKY